MLARTMAARRSELKVEEPTRIGDTKDHMARLFLTEARIANVPGGRVDIGAVRGFHKNGIRRQEDHNARMAKALEAEDDLERLGREAIAHSETLYGVSDRFSAIYNSDKSNISSEDRGLALASARAANTAGILNEIHGVVALGGVDALMARTGLDKKKAEALTERAGAMDILKMFEEKSAKTADNPELSWQNMANEMRDEDFKNAVHNAREEVLEKIVPRNSDDLEVRVRRAALDKYLSQEKESDIYGAQAKAFHQKVLSRCAEDSAEHRQMSAMITAIDQRGKTRKMSKDIERV